MEFKLEILSIVLFFMHLLSVSSLKLLTEILPEIRAAELGRKCRILKVARRKKTESSGSIADICEFITKLMTLAYL
jgi:hypothetical protein